MDLYLTGSPTNLLVVHHMLFPFLTAKPTGKRLLGRPWRRWEDNIKMDLKETGINTKDYGDSAQDRD